MLPYTNKVISKHVMQKNTQQENSGDSVRSDCFLEYIAAAKILKIPFATRHCITLTIVSIM